MSITYTKSILVPVSFNDGILDYNLPADCKPGTVVEVPFRNKSLYGIIRGEAQKGFDQSKIKSVNNIVDDFAISPKLLSFIDFTSDYYIVPKGEVLKLVFAGLKPKVFSYPEVKQELNYKHIDLSDDQKSAADTILKSVMAKQNILLEGVTGSGKTEVYCSVLNKIIEQNTDNQVLIMLPEICLTTQIIDRIKSIFGTEPVVWHSQITEKKRCIALRSIINGNAKLIVGARSALYLPYKNLTCIVVDEEHDQSYKQTDGGASYHARDMAIMRGFMEGFGVILATATPSIETYYNVTNGKYNKVSLSKRFHAVSLPQINIIDMKQNKNKCFISDELRGEILATIAKGKQVMLFLNRRGYAPLVLCRECGYRFSCPDCSAWMVKHSKQSILKCHHCDYTQHLPEHCPSCEAEDSLAYCGPGVERIYEEVKGFTSANVVMLSKDTADTVAAYQNLITEIKDAKVDIIIGTQMISKGLHFPGLELVGIIDADMSASSMDIRASERSYQLINQVAGRAGREEGIGRVFIQTYYPDNKVISAIKRQNLQDFLFEELSERHHFNLPPYTSQIAVIISGPNKDNLKNILKQISRQSPQDSNMEILGFTEAPMFKIRNNFRYRYLIKVSKNLLKCNKLIKQWLLPFASNNIRIKIDVDPYNFS